MADWWYIALRVTSAVLGWIYTISWSASFYPQPLLNWKRKSTHGLAIDFWSLNVLGFVCYTISTTCFMYSPVIRQQYADRHPASPEPTVRFNDVAYGFHAVILVILTYTQFFPSIWRFDVSESQRMSKVVASILSGSVIAIAAAFALVISDHQDENDSSSGWLWIDVIYVFSYVKLVATFSKYVPQAWVNFKRKSTVGWAISMILMDLVGSVLSLVQLVIDSSLQSDRSGISGNPLKFGLGAIGILFDLVFVVQHFLLYRRPSTKESIDESAESERPLLGSP